VGAISDKKRIEGTTVVMIYDKQPVSTGWTQPWTADSTGNT